MSAGPGAPDQAAPSSGFRTMWGSLKIRNYRLFCIGQLFSNTGQWMQRIAQDWLVLSITGSPTDVGFTVALQFLPALVIGLPGGLIADRYSKRGILRVTQCGMALLAVVLAGLTLSHAVRAWQIYAIAFLLGTFVAVDAPTRQSFVNELVGPAQLRNAISLNSAIFQAGALLGPAITGVLINLVGPGYAFAINALSYAGPIATLALMDGSRLRLGTVADRAPGQLRDGLRYVRDRPSLLWPTVMVGIFGMFCSNLPVTLAALAKYVFLSGAGGYGLLSSVVAVGSLIGALLTASGWPRMGWVVWSGLAVAVLCMAAAPVRSQLVFCGLLLLIGVFTMTMLAAANSIVQITAGDGSIDQHLGAQTGLFITGAVPGIVIGAVGIRLARLNRRAAAGAVPAEQPLAGPASAA